MKIHLVKHDKSGLGYAVEMTDLDTSCNTRWKVKFWQAIDQSVYFPSTCFKQGDLIDLGEIDDTDKLSIFQ